ncbi:thioredoxin domain-containing protein [Bryobacterales bacterium F-183]|nr:thioredoxin domain-containing protein [Bryobacterales bacterium F-183]
MPTQNRLVNEKSPYLLQHAHNPVDWYPWGEEAFAKARAEDKPIFLSIGYSTCHWCHVMERESFENEDTAAVVNRFFVPIKVDREERPDVDRIYMAFVQATSQRGGWPMSVFLTPDLKPFYGGTYFPPESRYGMPGFKALLEFLASKWKEDRQKIEGVSIETINQLESMMGSGGGTGTAEEVTRGAFDKLYNYLRRTFDGKYGGFGNRPKFPRPVIFDFLFRYHALTGAEDALDMATETLKEMAKGGMNDQLGGGFHRYSVDERWFVPHFEKMLYDQGQLAVSLVEAFQITGEELYAGLARDIFDYVRRDMTHPEGGFYSAEDADSVIDPANPKVKGEGAFYVWKVEELRELLTADELAEVRTVYGVKDGGNVDEDPHHEFTGTNILYVADGGMNPAALESAQKKMFEARAKRVRPHLDDKVLTSWNGLMISAFSKGAAALDDWQLLDAAKGAAHFVLKHLYQPEGARLLRRYRDGEAAIDGFLDDYATFATSLLDLYEASFEPFYFEAAVQLAGEMIRLFEDPEQGGFYSTREGDASLVLRLKEDYDGAEPSGNSMALGLLVRLAAMTGREDFQGAADRGLRHFAGKIASQGITLPRMVVAQMAAMSAPRQIVLTGPRTNPEMLAMLRVVRSEFLPDTAVFVLPDAAAKEALEAHVPGLAAMEIGEVPTAYVCEHFACKLPVRTATELREMLTRDSAQ